MKIVAKLALLAVACVPLLLFGAGIERIVWMFGGGGFAGSLPREVYRTIPAVRCDRPAIEAKHDADGVLRYRCGSYWPFSFTERSPELTASWGAATELAARLRESERTATDPDAVKPRS